MDVDGRRLYYAHHRASSDTRPSLILIHGAGGSHLDWPAELRRLGSYPVLIPDLPGHGRSLGSTRSSIEAYATLLDKWIGRLSMKDIVLLGHSMGGAIVLQQALQRAAPIRGIVVVASGARLRVADNILRGINERFPETVAALADAYWGPEAPADAIQTSRQRMHDAGRDLISADFSITDAFDVMGRLNAIRVPTLVIVGDRDRLTPPKYARYLAQNIPDARLHIIPGAQHMVHLQQPHLVARHVTDFLDRIA